MVDEGLRDERCAIATLQQAQTEVYILTEAHPFVEASELKVDGATAPEIEATGLKLLHPIGTTPTDPASSQRGGHRIVDRLLHRSEVIRGGIRSTEGIYGVALQILIYSRQIARGKYHVGVKDEEVFPRSLTCSTVAGLRRTAIGHSDVAEGGELRAEGLHYWLATDLRAILDDDDFIVEGPLLRQTL